MQLRGISSRFLNLTTTTLQQINRGTMLLIIKNSSRLNIARLGFIPIVNCTDLYLKFGQETLQLDLDNTRGQRYQILESIDGSIEPFFLLISII